MAVKPIDAAALRVAHKHIDRWSKKTRLCAQRPPVFRRRRSRMTYPLILGLATNGISIAVTRRVVDFVRQAFWKWRANPVPQREL